MSFSDQLWQSVASVYARILAHPFLTGLSDGSLPEESFRFYAVQDALYLREFARGLAILAAKAPEDELLATFAEHARDAILVERSLHDGFFAGWGLSTEEVYATPLAPVTLLYSSYLLRVAYERPWHEGIGAFLPCYWVYLATGKELEAAGSPHPLYARWIKTYAGAEFESVVRPVIAAADRMASELTEAQRRVVAAHFITATRLEWMFWEMGLRREGWPV